MTIGALTTVTEFETWNGGSGIYRPAAIHDALLLAEGQVSAWLSTALVPTQVVEEFPWPVDSRKMWLGKVRLISVVKVEGLFADGNCLWQSGLECSTIFDYRQSIIRIRDNYRIYLCNGLRCPERMKVTYIAGFSAVESAADSLDGTTLRAAVFNAALGFLQTSIGLNSTGNVFISSYSAAGYNESRVPEEQSGASLLQNQFIRNAKELVRRLQVKRPLNIVRTRGYRFL